MGGAFVRQLTERIGADALRFFMLPIIEQKANAAQNAGAHRAPVIGICAKFRICSFTDAAMTYGAVAGSPLGSPSGRAVTEGD